MSRKLILALLAGCILPVVAVILLGAVHIVRDRSGLTICAKQHWALRDNYVDTGNLNGHDLIIESALDKPLLADLYACGEVRNPRIPYGESCSFDGHAGLCMDTTYCNGPHQPGLCPGSSAVQCCALAVETH